MARSLDIETLVEDAFVNALTAWLDEDVSIIRWDDIDEKTLAPMVKIKAQVADDLPGTVNYFIATTLIVDFGVFTSKKADTKGRVGNGIRGDVRTMLCQSDIVDRLNIIPGLLVYNNGVMPQSSSDTPDPKMWQKGISVTVVATTKAVTN